MPLRLTQQLRTPQNTAELLLNSNSQNKIINQNYLAKLTDFLPDIIYIYDLINQRTLFVNKAFTKILGYSQNDLLSNLVSWTDIVHDEDWNNRFEIINSIAQLKDGETIEYEIRCKTAKEKYIWLHHKLTVFTRDIKGNPEQVLVTSHDITYRKKLEVKLLYQLYTDQLTGIPNRTNFLEKLEQRIENKTFNFALLFIDLNEFKVVNDVHGHQIGDKVLVKTAKRLTSIFKSPHVVARLSGDEFTIIIDNCIDKKTLDNYVEKINRKFERKILIDTLEFTMCMSIGKILAKNIENPTCTKLLKLADEDMYEAKKRYYATKMPPRRNLRDIKKR
jgi:diguanylate cyclase (GGDEF)-like protein/PAS domain S-box-containing protein